MELPHPLLAAWNRHLALERRRSVHTVRAYVACAQRLLQFLTVHCGASPSGALLAALPAADLRAYLAHRRAQGLGNASTARELSALRAFLAFAGGDDAVIPPLRGPRVKKGVPRPVAPDEVIALAEDVAENAAEPWIAARNWAVLGGPCREPRRRRSCLPASADHLAAAQLDLSSRMRAGIDAIGPDPLTRSLPSRATSACAQEAE
jgi:site-specific recombinase XerC